MRDRIDSSQLQLPGISLGLGAADYVDSVYDLSAEDVERLKTLRPRKLGIVCGRSECKKDLHLFRPPLSNATSPSGGCQVCGNAIIPWGFMQTHDLSKINQKTDILKTEWIRHFFFNVPIPPRVKKFAESHGLAGLDQVAHDQLTCNKMLTFNKDFDWNQTKMLDGNIVHWARHAVACCCRRCMAYWHNVPLNAKLADVQIEYFRQFIMSYVKMRLPALNASANPISPKAASVDHLRKAM